MARQVVPRSLPRDAGVVRFAQNAKPGGEPDGLCKARPGAVMKTPRWRAMRRAVGPRWPCSGRRLVVAAGRTSRRLPGAGDLSRTRMTPHESALWRTERTRVSGFRVRVLRTRRPGM